MKIIPVTSILKQHFSFFMLINLSFILIMDIPSETKGRF